MQSASGKLSPNQRGMVDDVCLTLGIALERGQLTLRCGAAPELGEAVQRVAQGVLRVSDIWFTSRTRSMETIGDEVDQWLRARSFDVKRRTQRTGHSKRTWTVDYEVVFEARTSLVFLLSTGNQSWRGG